MSYASDALIDSQERVIDAQEREIKKLESENASLKGAAQGLGRLCDQYKAENDKLRDLVSVVYGYYASGTKNPCDICDSIGCQYVGEAESGCRYHDRFDRAEAAEDEILKRMRKFGIEVE